MQEPITIEVMGSVPVIEEVSEDHQVEETEPELLEEPEQEVLTLENVEPLSVEAPEMEEETEDPSEEEALTEEKPSTERRTSTRTRREPERLTYDRLGGSRKTLSPHALIAAASRHKSKNQSTNTHGSQQSKGKWTYA